MIILLYAVYTCLNCYKTAILLWKSYALPLSTPKSCFVENRFRGKTARHRGLAPLVTVCCKSCAWAIRMLWKFERTSDRNSWDAEQMVRAIQVVRKKEVGVLKACEEASVAYDQ